MRKHEDKLSEALAQLKQEGQSQEVPKEIVDETLRTIADCSPGSESGVTTLRIADLTGGSVKAEGLGDGFTGSAANHRQAALDDATPATINPQFRGLFPAYFSSTCGGHTTGGEEVFGDSFAPLKGVPCLYCKDVAKLGLFYWPTATFERTTVTKQLLEKYPKLSVLGEIADLAAIEESCYGSYSRLTRIRLTGTTGKTDTLRAEDLRLAIDHSGSKIRSAICRIIPWGTGWAFVSGRGWGHGVGMCQHGAEGMARLGSDAESILQHYYPGAEIVNVY